MSSSSIRTTQPKSKAGFLPARSNPLNISHVTGINFRFQTGDWNSEIERLRTMNFRGSIVGLQGAGKSTLLRELNSQLKAREIGTHYVYIPNPDDFKNSRHQLGGFSPQAMLANIDKAVRVGQVILLDGIERIGYFHKRRLIRITRSASIIVTSHQRCHLPTWIHSQPTPNLMEDILSDLGLDQAEIQTAGQLAFQKSGGNIRLALRDLYDQLASGRFNKILSL